MQEKQVVNSVKLTEITSSVKGLPRRSLFTELAKKGVMLIFADLLENVGSNVGSVSTQL